MKINTKQTSEPFVVAAPIGGLNGRDPLASMSPTDAYLLDNAFPNTASVESRNGCAKHTDDELDGPVQTLEVYSGADGDQMLAWAGTKIYDVSLTTPAELETGMVSALAITTMFSNAADNAQHMIAVTGYDTPKHYDGGTISDLTMTGIASPTHLNYVFSFKERLYFGEREKLGFHYLAVGAIQGALSYFDLAQVSRLGGYLVNISSYSEGGETPQDYIVFITSKGECIVYAGYDPSNADTWQLVGRYFAATPIGARCTIHYNAELIILTLQGAIPFSLVRKNGDPGSKGVSSSVAGAITSKLGKYLSDYNTNANVPGWAGIQYSRAGWLLINVPATSGTAGAYYHYVMNTTTGSWCRFKNWNGMSFCVFNDRLYFGRYDGYVMLGDEGTDDDGDPIRWDVKQAYNYFADERGAGPLQKHFQWASLIVQCDGAPPLSGKFNVDFKEEAPQYVSNLVTDGGAAWDVEAWDVGAWASEGTTQKFLITLNKGGFAGALWLRASLTGLTLKWYATQYVMQRTQGLLI